MAVLAADRLAGAEVVFDGELLALIVGLVVLIGIGVVVTMKLRSSARRDVAPLPEHSLAHYQDLLDKGLIDRQELERIRALLNEKPPTPPTRS